MRIPVLGRPTAPLTSIVLPFVLSTLLTVGSLSLEAGSVLADPTPPILWTDQWNGPGNHDDFPNVIGTDPFGGFYVGGSTYENGVGANREDYFLNRYAVDGTIEWTRILGETGYDDLTAMITGPGWVTVTGITTTDNTFEVTTLSYDDAGNLLWEDRFPISGTFWREFTPRMVQDADGNFLISAHSAGDYLVLKYDSDGTLLWSQSYDGPAGGDDFASDIAVDAAGNVFVAGIVPTSAQFGSAIGTIKLDANGVFQWEQFESGDIGSVFLYAGVRVGPDGHPVVTGNPESVCGVFELRVWKCDSATGAPLWVESYPPEPCHSMEPIGMTMDGDGNALVTSFGHEVPFETHFHTFKYAPDGTLLWHRLFDGAGTSEDIPRALTLDDAGNLYVAGLTNFPPQNRDYAAVKYSPDGDELWTLHWPDPQGTNAWITAVAVTSAGDVIFSGQVYDSAHQEDAVTLYLRQQDPAAVSPFGSGAVPGPGLEVSQNPFVTGTNLRFELGSATVVSLGVHDASGRIVRRLTDGAMAAGAHEVAWDGAADGGGSLASGVYFVRLVAEGEGTSTIAVRLVH
ncbi:MAG: SBBP repeat-containing protein [Candidatus Eisenbacteria bacterium]